MIESGRRLLDLGASKYTLKSVLINSSQEPIKVVGIKLESGIIVVAASSSILIWRLSFGPSRRSWDFLFILVVVLPVHVKSRNWISHAFEDLR